MLRLVLLSMLTLMPYPSSAQLVVQHTVNLGTQMAGEYVHCAPHACGEVLLASHVREDIAPIATVTGLPLRHATGKQSLDIIPQVTCLNCLDPRSAQPLRWGLGASVHVPPDIPSGPYSGMITLIVAWSSGERDELDIPVELHVRAAFPTCSIAQSQSLDFGRIVMGQAHSVLLDPTAGVRLVNGQRRATGPAYRMPTLRIATTAAQVLVTVTSSGQLQGPGGGVRFTSLLASRSAASQGYTLAIEGPGSVALGFTTHTFRLGGRIEVPPTLSPGTYRGHVHVRYSCF